MSYLFSGSSRFHRHDRNETPEPMPGSLVDEAEPVGAFGMFDTPEADPLGLARDPELLNAIEFVAQEALQKKASDILASCGNPVKTVEV